MFHWSHIMTIYDPMIQYYENVWSPDLISYKCMILWSHESFFHDPMILILRFDEPGPYKPWSHGYDLGHLMISWLWSRKNRDLKFLDHQIPWSHDYDPANSMILRIFNFWLWALNCAYFTLNYRSWLISQLTKSSLIFRLFILH